MHIHIFLYRVHRYLTKSPSCNVHAFDMQVNVLLYVFLFKDVRQPVNRVYITIFNSVHVAL